MSNLPRALAWPAALSVAGALLSLRWQPGRKQVAPEDWPVALVLALVAGVIAGAASGVLAALWLRYVRGERERGRLADTTVRVLAVVAVGLPVAAFVILGLPSVLWPACGDFATRVVPALLFAAYTAAATSVFPGRRFALRLAAGGLAVAAGAIAGLGALAGRV